MNDEGLTVDGDEKIVLDPGLIDKAMVERKRPATIDGERAALQQAAELQPPPLVDFQEPHPVAEAVPEQLDSR